MIEHDAAAPMQTRLLPVGPDDVVRVELRDAVGRVWDAACRLVLCPGQAVTKHLRRRCLKKARVRKVLEHERAELLRHKGVGFRGLARCLP